MIKIAAARARDKKAEQIPKKRKGTPKKVPKEELLPKSVKAVTLVHFLSFNVVELVDVDAHSHCRPSAIGDGRIECGKLNAGGIDAGDGVFARKFAVSARNAIAVYAAYLALISFLIHKNLLLASSP
jgi:hypothetical protein